LVSAEVLLIDLAGCVFVEIILAVGSLDCYGCSAEFLQSLMAEPGLEKSLKVADFIDVFLKNYSLGVSLDIIL